MKEEETKKDGFRGFLRQLLHLGDSPERTALAFSVGVFLSFSPFIGFHTIIGLAIAFLFRLNRLAVLIGTYVNTPWTFAPVASFGAAVGFYALGTESRLSAIAWNSMLSISFWRHMFSDVDHLLLPFFVGNLILSVLASLISYLIVRRILVRYHRRKELREAGG
ncbi:MAG: DUF2062 domain-containing protein [Vicinamibacteria bacterium]